MPSAEFFEKLGLFVRHGFVRGAELERLHAAVMEAGRSPATVRKKGSDDRYTPDVRRTLWADVDERLMAEMEERYARIRSEVADHFGRDLSSQTGTQFLVYGEGDHFKVHRDNSADRLDDPHSRKISALVFLNEPGDGSGHFRGGRLTFYGLLPSDEQAEIGLSLEPEPGLLVAFPAETLHGVEPVTSGLRYTIVTWYC